VLILLVILWLLTFNCSNSAASSQGTCTANQPLGGLGVALVWILAFVFTVLTIEVWLVSLIRTGGTRAWSWFVLCLIIPPIGPLLYGIFGPEESRSEPPPYVEGTPRTPVTSS
jgi:Phospholipase_D-nuclease N-terminal